MPKPIYTNNYRRNLELYWQQYFPNWSIPEGYHVHHIKPISTFEDRNDSRMHYPSNLIALHPDDHQSIHKCRGDVRISSGLLSIKDRRLSDRTKKLMSKQRKGKPKTKEHVEKYSAPQRGVKRKPLTDETKQKISEGRKGFTHSAESKRLMSESKRKKRKPLSEEHKKAISDGLKNRRKKNCSLR